VFWSTVDGQPAFAQSVTWARLYTGGALALISALYLLVTSQLILRPLNSMHSGFQAVLNGGADTRQRLWSHAAHEFWTLSESVDTLQHSLSERDTREAELEEQRERAFAASRAKSSFLANMSHEIRTPMNGVIGMAQLMMETELDEDQHLYASTIERSGTALVQIINDILDYSKVDAGRMVLHPDPFDLLCLLEEVGTLLAAEAAKKGLELGIGYAPDLPRWFIGDAGRLRQVIMNIVGNAVKFTETGYIEIRVAGEPKGAAWELSISIRDTGVGIAADQLDTVFRAFEQADNASTRRFDGTGLGLAISNQITQLMGGNISVTSSLGDGSTFTLSIPLPVSENQPAAPDKTRHRWKDGLAALVVDDLEVNRRILRERLEGWGVSVIEADSAETALNVLSAHDAPHVDIAILDYQMPGRDGISLARDIGANERYASTALILCSSVDMTSQDAETAGLFADSIQKPVLFDRLHSAISRATFAASGTHTVMTVPSQGHEAGTGLPDKTNPEPAGDPVHHILIAEDNRTNQLVISSMLKKLPYAIDFAENGEIAVNKFRETRPDLVVMDVSMPVMDGLEATRQIRALQDSAPRTPVIALTAHALDGDREGCLAAGMDDFLSKPARKSELIACIEKWLGLAGNNNALGNYPSQQNDGADETSRITQIAAVEPAVAITD